jgi:hypothetical protein
MERRRKNMRTFIITVLGILLSAPPVWPCHLDNLVTNCGFDTDITGWSTFAGSCVHNTNDGSSAVGNIECDAESSGGFFVVTEQCITSGVTGDTTYSFGADARLVSGSNVNCQVATFAFSDATCTISGSSQVSPFFNPGAAYTQSVATSFLTPAGTQSVGIRVQCFSSNDFVLRSDDVFFGVNLVPVELQEFWVE